MKEKKWKSGSKWTKKFYCKKFRLANDYEHESEEKKKKNKAIKLLIKKSHLKNQQILTQKNLMNWSIKKKHT